LERAAEKLNAALATGDGLKGASKDFEDTFGEGSATHDNMATVASNLGSMASALRDTGSGAISANAMSSADLTSQYGVGSDVLADVPTNGPKMVLVNVDHPGFNSRSTLGWAAGHETAHAVLGYRDETMRGIKAYRYGQPAQREIFKTLPTEQRLINPDHLMEQSQ
jgi:hypothetical protein